VLEHKNENIFFLPMCISVSDECYTYLTLVLLFNFPETSKNLVQFREGNQIHTLENLMKNCQDIQM
jgi:hypothetical protein